MRIPSSGVTRQNAMSYEPIWVESNEQKEAARSLEMLHVQLISAVIDPYAWKWVLLTLHHSLHAFLVASLSPSSADAPEDVEECGRALRLHAHRAERAAAALPRDLTGLYARVKEATGYRPVDGIDEDVARLVIYHEALFERCSSRWTLRVNEMPRLAQNCLRFIEYLGWNPGHIAWQKENLTDLARVKFLASVKVLDALDSRYGSA